ncbi:MAG: acetyl-CoA carboxylase, biotin carboxyl carrier protein [Flavobacteriales bacterium]|nr:acetyl-CoA carboxylase, biotin carboxyl carrier protein [Flavobacteriales bacterium]
MNLRQIQELIKFVAKSGATEVDLEIGDVKLSIKSPPKGKVQNNEQAVTTQVIPLQQPVVQSPVAPQPITQTQQVNPPALTNISESTDNVNSINEEDNKNYITVKAPIIGTFYRRSSPEKEPFVNVGDKINVNDPLCIIEAMKLFNEIESEFSGTVVKVLVDDMSPVEYDQPLFLIDPS